MLQAWITLMDIYLKIKFTRQNIKFLVCNKIQIIFFPLEFLYVVSSKRSCGCTSIHALINIQLGIYFHSPVFQVQTQTYILKSAPSWHFRPQRKKTEMLWHIRHQLIGHLFPDWVMLYDCVVTEALGFLPYNLVGHSVLSVPFNGAFCIIFF